MKTKQLLYIVLFTFISCKNSEPIKNTLCSSDKWFDNYGNEYKFQNGKIEWKPYLSKLWWDIGSYRTKKKSLFITCSRDTKIIKELKLKLISKKHLLFNNSIKICEPSLPINESEKEFEIWRSKRSIIDENEKIISIEFKAIPNLLYSGIRTFKLRKDKMVEIGYIDENTIDTTYFLNDSIYENIEKLAQILPLEKYENKYEYYIIDGVNFEIKVKTNKKNKEITCNGGLPNGLDNLISYINHEIKGANNCNNQ